MLLWVGCFFGQTKGHVSVPNPKPMIWGICGRDVDVVRQAGGSVALGVTTLAHAGGSGSVGGSEGVAAH